MRDGQGSVEKGGHEVSDSILFFFVVVVFCFFVFILTVSVSCETLFCKKVTLESQS